MGKLKASEVEKLPPGMHGDGDALYLQVTGGNARSWIYRFKLNGKTREMGLGSARDISLKDAREMRNEAAVLRAKGIDPLEQRQQQQAATAPPDLKTLTFEQAAERFMAANRPAWTSDVHAEQVESSLKTYVYPAIGRTPIPDINRTMVIDALRPIWHTKGETARRVRQRIWSVFENAFAHDETLQMRNPADLKPITAALGKQNKIKRHYAGLPFEDIGGFMALLRARPRISGRCLEFTILCAARTNESIGAKWTEINWRQRTWTIPAERMKNRVEHVVPLSARALDILQDLRKRSEGAYIFPGQKPGRPLSNMAMLALLNLMDHSEITTHGFRSAFRTWAGERTNFQREVIEKALSHTVGDEVERSYNLGILLEKRRALMDAWANYCAGKPVSATEDGSNVKLVVAA